MLIFFVLLHTLLNSLWISAFSYPAFAKTETVLSRQISEKSTVEDVGFRIIRSRGLALIDVRLLVSNGLKDPTKAGLHLPMPGLSFRKKDRQIIYKDHANTVICARLKRKGFSWGEYEELQMTGLCHPKASVETIAATETSKAKRMLNVTFETLEPVKEQPVAVKN